MDRVHFQLKKKGYNYTRPFYIISKLTKITSEAEFLKYNRFIIFVEVTI